MYNMGTSTKKQFDKALESIEEGACLCLTCVKTHYPKEFKIVNTLFIYRLRCDACGEKSDYCTWTSVWRRLLFKSKPIDYLIGCFEKEAEHRGSLLTHRATAGWEMIERGKEALETIFKHTPNTPPEAWINFFKNYAEHHGITMKNVIPENLNINDWRELLQVK